MRTTLPARYYVDPQWFAAEMERLFAGHVDLRRAGSTRSAARGEFIRRDVAGASVLIVSDGRRTTPRAFHNVCRHRGTRLCDASRRHVSGQHPVPVSRAGPTISTAG